MVSVGDAIRIAITGDGHQAVSEFKKVGNAAKSNLADAEKSGKSMGTALTKVGIGAAGAGLAIGAGLFKAAQAASAAQLEHEKLNNTIKNSPQLAGASVAAFERQQKAIEGTTVVDDEAVAGLQALLGQFKLNQAGILQLTPGVVDLGRKTGDLEGVAKAVGKAYETGATKGLKNYGINLKLSADPTKRLTQLTDELRRVSGG